MEILFICYLLLPLIISIISLIYNIKNKRIEIVTLNILTILVIILYSMAIFMISNESNINTFGAIFQIILLLTMAAGYVSIIKILISAIKNKKMPSKDIGALIFLIIFIILFNSVLSIPRQLMTVDEDGNIVFDLKGNIASGVFLFCIFGIPIVNLFFTAMFKNKNEKGE